jgi:hypothetical protein
MMDVGGSQSRGQLWANMRELIWKITKAKTGRVWAFQVKWTPSRSPSAVVLSFMKA